MEYCTSCGGKLGFMRNKPKKEWGMSGYLHGKCYDEIKMKMTDPVKVQRKSQKIGIVVTIGFVIIFLSSIFLMS